MYRSRPSDDSAWRWRQFSRRGWRLAWLFAALWFGGLALLFRLAPAPVPSAREAPVPLAWWPAGGGAALDVRALWTPSAFALSSPAGFSHSLRRARAGLPPPIQTARPAAAFLVRPNSAAAFDLAKLGPIWGSPSSPPIGSGRDNAVFPPRVPAREMPRLSFPDGWESRLFSGIDLNFGAWTNGSWSARVEMRFDAQGVPVSTLLAQSSGDPEVDRRLARSAHGWRLLEPDAPRTGIVAWNSPATGALAAAEGGTP
jgi:hypothetical protein